MTDTGDSLARFDRGLGRAVLRIAQGFALAGGGLMVLLMLMSVVSIAGRWLLARPLPGDYEIAQLVTAVAVAAFLPYCALRSGHVLVDFLTARAGRRLKGVLDAVGNLAIAAIGALIAWRMAFGLADLRDSGETTMVLGIPQWMAYVPMVASFALLAVVGLYMAWHHARCAWSR